MHSLDNRIGIIVSAINQIFHINLPIVVRFVPWVIDHNLGNRMLGQARPNSITQVMIYNLGYDPRVGNELVCLDVFFYCNNIQYRLNKC